MKKYFVALLFTIIIANTSKGQNLYYRLDIATGNVFSFAIANVATAVLNDVTDKMLFDNAFSYTYLKEIDGAQNIDVKANKILGLTARDVFNDVKGGGKIGYQTDNKGFFNWTIFASAHYRINQFKIAQNEEVIYRQNIQRTMLGGGLQFTLGSIEKSVKCIIEAGLTYDLPLSYSGSSGYKVNDLVNSGLSSHFAVMVNGRGILNKVGLYADIPFYKTFKNAGSQMLGTNIKPYSFGVTYTITPWKKQEK